MAIKTPALMPVQMSLTAWDDVDISSDNSPVIWAHFGRINGSYIVIPAIVGNYELYFLDLGLRRDDDTLAGMKFYCLLFEMAASQLSK